MFNKEWSVDDEEDDDDVVFVLLIKDNDDIDVDSDEANEKF